MVPKSGVGRVWEMLKTKHEKVSGCFMVPKSGVEKRSWVLPGSQEWGGKGLGSFKNEA